MLKALKTYFTGARTAIAAKAARSSSTLWTSSWFTSLLGGRSSRTLLQRFTGIVYSCIRANAEALSDLTWKVYTTTSVQDGQTEAPAENWFVKLKARPNPHIPWITWETLIEQTEEWQSVKGKAYWWFPRDADSRTPRQIWIVPPDIIEPYGAGDEMFSGFRLYTPRGLVYLGKDEVCYLPLLKPDPDMVGSVMGALGRIEAAIDAIDVGWYNQLYLKHHYQRRALPELVLETTSEIYEKDKAPFLKQFLSKFQGPDGSGEPAFLPAGVKPHILDTTANAKSMLAMAQEMNRQIASVFKVPMGILTGEFDSAAPAASYHANRFVFYKHGTAPRAKRIGAVLTRFIQEHHDPALIIGHEPIEWQDPEEVRADENHRLRTGRATVNDIRKENGEELSTEPIADTLLVAPDLLEAYVQLAGDPPSNAGGTTAPATASA